VSTSGREERAACQSACWCCSSGEKRQQRLKWLASSGCQWAVQPDNATASPSEAPSVGLGLSIGVYLPRHKFTA